VTQNLISLSLGADQLAAIDGALSTLEREFADFIAMPADERRHLTKMGAKSEAFCRQAMDVMGANPKVLPGNFDLSGLQQDLATLDLLRPRLVRLSRLLELANDTETALGSDLMNGALEGYALLKVSGKGEGVEGLRRTLSARFNRAPRGSATTAGE
jgi:hypothetical protein